LTVFVNGIDELESRVFLGVLLVVARVAAPRAGVASTSVILLRNVVVLCDYDGGTRVDIRLGLAVRWAAAILIILVVVIVSRRARRLGDPSAMEVSGVPLAYGRRLLGFARCRREMGRQISTVPRLASARRVVLPYLRNVAQAQSVGPAGVDLLIDEASGAVVVDILDTHLVVVFGTR
jgi:hypothetical protein